ncbi:hypothetical protein FisN_21Lh183 [Fistulifera solaris]|uniref:Uncharacterized protein n=1 Tax=Fistulifera solaris TaxID=1519565 RepID=A0A1Z5J9B4_FISSO|nr:hypothetical protein FisN_21Lh183 [Fistulifera solaris]|eukprot:GAX10482.1 hypothetical protein FisN_21Lh183 [Fistulifera solaris]
MPIEINKSAFAAVDALFGREERSETKQQQQKPVIDTSRRLGVGAKPTAKNLDPVSSKILQVGRKRQRENEGHVEESLFESVAHDDSDEEDLGRTAIDSNNKVAATSSAVIPESTTKKRKNGKKERASSKANGEHRSKSDSTQPANFSQDTCNSLSQIEDAEQEPKASTSSTKRKRRKIRSKQKNIYKDQREKKPEHLIVGSKNYKGRPLTAETRAKLNLPATKSSSNPSFSGTWTGEGAQASEGKTEESHAVEKTELRPSKDSVKKEPS